MNRTLSMLTKHVLYILGCMLFVCSCQIMSFEEEDSTPDSSRGEKLMHFKVTGFNLDSFEELDTRATEKSGTDNLLLGIYDLNGNLLDSIEYQDKDDYSFGKFSRTLKYGKYTILALGWDGSQQCHVASSDSIYFSEGWVPNTLLCRQNIVVSESYSDTRTLSLKRCTARFAVYLKDEHIPSNLSKFVISSSDAGNVLNSETKHCANIKDFSRTIDVNIELSKIKYVSSYFFLPEDSANINISVAALDVNGEELGKQNFINVPMKINYATNYSGKFFPYASESGEIVFELDYDGEYNHEF